nr:unnamed protein product [Digitaria exilis]
MERNPNPGGTKSGVPDGRRDGLSRGILLQRPGFLCLGAVAGVARSEEPLPASEAATKPGPCIGSPRVWCYMSRSDQSRRRERTSAARRRW